MTDRNPDDDAAPEFPDPADFHAKMSAFFRRHFPDEAELTGSDPEEAEK